MATPKTISSADLPDSSVLNTLAVVRQTCIIAVAVVSTLILCAWSSPTLGILLPPGWALMKANTALCALLCVASLALGNPKFSSRTVLLSRLFAGLAVLLAAAVLYEYGGRRLLGIDTLLAPDILSRQPGMMSPHTSFCFLLLGVVLLFIHVRRQWISHIIDGLTLCLVFLLLVYISGYCFGAMHLFGTSMQNRISIQTLFCLSLLTVAVFPDRMKSGVFSVLFGAGIAGQTARLALPFMFVLPFLIALLRGIAVKTSLMQPEYATAFASSSSAMLYFCLLLMLSLRIAGLERNIHDLSVRDDLTSLYNRRGFYVLATHDLKFANRSGIPFSVLFFDVDNLKQINDSLGHEAGSRLLQEFALILISTMRATDIIGRLGGDEFVIAGSAPAAEIEQVIRRIDEAVSCVNAQHGRSFLVSYSLGYVTSAPARCESLDDLLERADKIMYQAKRDKRAARADSAGSSWNAVEAMAPYPAFPGVQRG